MAIFNAKILYTNSKDKKVYFLNFRKKLIGEIVEIYLKAKNKTSPTTHVNRRLRHVTQHFPVQCFNNKGDKYIGGVRFVRKQIQTFINIFSMNLKHVPLYYIVFWENISQ